MTDIVERLRIRQPLLGTLCDEAADEIKRLRNDYSVLKQDYDALRAEVERLRTTLGYLTDNIDNPALVAVAEAALVERLRQASLQTDYGLDIDKELMDEGWREIERLRAALTHISEHGDMPSDQLAMVALRALEPKP